MIIVLFGKPGAGKGTQAPLLANALHVSTLATGDVLRAALRDGTSLGREAKAFMERGDLVPDAVILGIVAEALADPKFEAGAILDGVVRTVPQAEGLERALGAMNRRVDHVVCFDIEDEEIVRRLSGRTVCEKCQTPYTGLEAGAECTQPGCGGRVMRRKDDDPDAIRNRLAVYASQTAPVLDWYQTNGAAVHTIDAVGSVHDVTKRALRSVGR